MTTTSPATIKVVTFPRTRGPETPLGNRQLGEEERALLEREVAEAKPGEIVGIDARGVRRRLRGVRGRRVEVRGGT